jgi:cell shape-determining protein MreC
MKNYLSTKRGSSRRTWLPRGFVLTFVGVMVIVILSYIVPKLVFSLVSLVVYPFDTARTWVLESNSSLPYYLRDRHALITDIEAQKQSLAMCGSSENTLTKLRVENEQFRQLCGAVPEERIIARVVGRPPQMPYDIIMLDRGSSHGVIENSPVYAGSDQVLGYVSRVYDKTALVTLVSTAGFKSMAYIIGPNIYTYAEGVGGGMLRVVVPQGLPLAVEDTVILPAIDSGVYGRIASIETSPTQPEQYGYVPMSQNLQSLQYVSVGRSPIVPHSYDEAEKLVAEMKTELFKVALPEGVLVTPQGTTSSTTLATSSTASSSTE